MWENGLAGMGICWMAALGWRVTLARWQNWPSLDQCAMSVDIPVHTHLTNMRGLVALMPRWASVWMAVKAAYPKGSGRSGQAGGGARGGLGLAMRQAAQGPCEAGVDTPPHPGHTSTTPSPVAIA